MDERVRFIAGLRSGLGMAEACRSYGVSRKTGYKWLERYKLDGPSGLEERSRAPHRMPWAIDDDMQELLIAARCRHPTWGPRKLLAWLERRHRGRLFPAASSVGDLLRRRGFVKPRRRRRQIPPRVARPGRFDAPNATWCADFKGWFRTSDGKRCDPLTISDGYSRFIVGCHIVERPTLEHVQPQFERAFIEYGLPNAIRTDNGPPFASTGLGGLSRLAVWWLRLGITPDRIDPGRPDQNGRHERFHKTLKAETASPPASTHTAQQRRFDRFTREYNEDRPHESLADDTPADLYAQSPRSFPRALPDVEYPADYLVRSIHTAGTLKWKGSQLYVSEALIGQRVGLEPIADDQWLIYFAALPLAVLDNRPKTAFLRPI
jgi:transposase InsO family protein